MHFLLKLSSRLLVIGMKSRSDQFWLKKTNQLRRTVSFLCYKGRCRCKMSNGECVSKKISERNRKSRSETNSARGRVWISFFFLRFSLNWLWDFFAVVKNENPSERVSFFSHGAIFVTSRFNGVFDCLFRLSHVRFFLAPGRKNRAIQSINQGIYLMENPPTQSINQSMVTI